MKNAKLLTPRQQRFVEEYLVDLNATQAAIRAGYSPRTARAVGSENLTKPDVSAAIAAAQAERSQRTGVTADIVLLELLNIARADIAEAFNADGSLKPLHSMPEGIRRAIASVDVDELFEGRGEEREQIGFTKKLKLWNKVSALELLGKHLRLWVEKVEASGPGGGPIPVKSEGAMSDAELQARISQLLTKLGRAR